jgi:hypothetical protein
VNGNRADQGGAASAGRKSVGCTSIPAQRRAVKAIPVDDVEQIARGCKGDSNWNSDALILCEDVAFALLRKVPALSGIPLLEVEGVVKDTVHQQIEDALRDVISCAVEVIIDVQQDMIETPHEPRSAAAGLATHTAGKFFNCVEGQLWPMKLRNPSSKS